MRRRAAPMPDVDDALFRARLAPLAEEVLPAAPQGARDASPSEIRARVRVARPGLSRLASLMILGMIALAAGTTAARIARDKPAAKPVAAALAPAPVPDTAPYPIVPLLLQRGDAAMATGDIAAARLLFERAVAEGSIAAATALGRSYDGAVLAGLGARGIPPDPAQAARWYRKAAAFGDAEAIERLARLDERAGP